MEPWSGGIVLHGAAEVGHTVYYAGFAFQFHRGGGKFGLEFGIRCSQAEESQRTGPDCGGAGKGVRRA